MSSRKDSSLPCNLKQGPLENTPSFFTQFKARFSRKPFSSSSYNSKQGPLANTFLPSFLLNTIYIKGEKKLWNFHPKEKALKILKLAFWVV
jgi:hypothetical protein